MKTKKTNIAIFALLSAAALFSSFAFTSCSGKNEIPEDATEISDEMQNGEAAEGTAGEQEDSLSPELITIPELKILSEAEDDKWIIVETTYCKFRYPMAFSDVMSVEAASYENSVKLRFMMNMDEGSTDCYSVLFNDPNNTAAIPCGVLKTSDSSEEIPVSVVFEKVPEGMNEDWEATFYAVQETFNDVLYSMGEYNSFTAVQ